MDRVTWYSARKNPPPRPGVYLIWHQQEKAYIWNVGTFGVGLFGGGHLWTLGGIFPAQTVDAETTDFYWTEPPMTPPEQEARKAVFWFCAKRRKGADCTRERCPLYKFIKGEETCKEAALKNWEEARAIICSEE